MANHLTPSAAKRRRLEDTEGSQSNSGESWCAYNEPTSQTSAEYARTINDSSDVTYRMNGASLGSVRLPNQWNHPFDQSWHSMNNAGRDLCLSLTPTSGLSTAMVGENQNGFANHHDYFTSRSVTWNNGNQLGKAEPYSNSSWMDERQLANSLPIPFPPAQVPNRYSQAHPFNSPRSLQWSASVQSTTFIENVSVEAQMTLSSWQNTMPAPASNIPSTSDRAIGSSEDNSGVPSSDLVCYGMIQGISGECQIPTGSYPTPNYSRYPITLDNASKFSSCSNSDSSGSISNKYTQLLQALLDESSLKLQSTCILEDEKVDNAKKRRYLPSTLPCSLSIIIYGPAYLCEEIGDFFQEYDTYLQDPHGCDIDVRYCNPHRMSSIDLACCPMTSELISQGSLPETFNLEEATRQPELLAFLDSQEDLLEASQPRAIHTALERHQKQALSFMLKREKGWALDSASLDVWEMKKIFQGHAFINRISNAYQMEEPPQFHGGIIADPMGLGKTLTMISLIATDLERDRSTDFVMNETTGDSVPNQTTLVIVPAPLLDTWEEQLSHHVTKSCLTWRRHHGKSRITNATELSNFNVILTTYHTISSEWKTGIQNEKFNLFSIHWKRVILDEAHVIRNSMSQMAKSICAIAATSRWAVTGTPIQNRLGDLVALLKFLRSYPYDDTRRFDADISHLWKTGEAEEAVRRLKKLSKCLLLRRPKETINLPPRRDLRCVVDFTVEERELYDDIKNRTIASLKESTTETTNPTIPVTFVNVIQQINSLRMICNMGLQYHSRYENSPTEDELEGQNNWAEVAQQAFNFQCEAGSIACQVCSSLLDVMETLLDDPANQTQPRFSQCLRFICSECTQRLHRASKSISCGHSPSHPIAPISLSRMDLEDTTLSLHHMDDDNESLMGLPSKVTSLVTQLKAQLSDVKCLVFSTWRMTLEVVEAGLKQARIQYVRFDGKVPQAKRQAIIDKFRKDPMIKVMILTLSCGAVGLTLTEASQAYLMEPHWNPTIEEQALARIHRIGQKKEVTTIRFFVRDTFEERVMQIQESKKDLAGVLFSAHGDGQAENVGRLEWLCNLL